MAPVIEAAPDLAQLLDPSEIWPDPADCPDWPISFGPSSGLTVQGPAAARARLEHLTRFLSGGRKVSTGMPSLQDRKRLRAEFFTTERVENAWAIRHGVRGLGPAHPKMADRATAIVEAAHIRGYLRKLELADQAMAERDKAAKESSARVVLAQAQERHAAALSEYKGLEIAAARHEQRCADERAFRRRQELQRHTFPGIEADVRAAANTLGVAPPVLETVE